MVSNMRVGRKLFCGFSAVLAVVLGMSLATGSILMRFAEVSHRNGVAGSARDDLAAAVEGLRQASLDFADFAINGDAAFAPPAREAMDQLRRGLDSALRRVPADRQDVRRAVKAARGVADSWLDGYARHMLEAMHGTDGQAIISTSVIGNPMATDMVVNAVDGADRMVRLWSDQEGARERRAIRELVAVFAAGTLLTALLSGLIGWLITRAIARPVDAVVAAMGRLAADDLEVAVPGTARRDEAGDIARAAERFKAAAIEKRAMEARTAAERTDAERERAGREHARAAQAEEQRAVVAGLAGALSRLAEGDLCCELPTPFADAYEALRTDFNHAVSALRDAMGGIAAAAGTIRGGTGQVARASDELSRRTEQQAASLEQTAAALEQLTATVRRSAEGAAHAGGLVSGARARAAQSGTVVRDTVAAMEAIEASSNRIGQIIGVIDEIAFQTNLLALNAGVEAARAGDAGRGFAVVASEVRALAQRSSGAAKEIRGLIAAGEAEVRQGVALVARTGGSLDEIAAEVERIGALMTELVAASREQATGLGEINTAVNQLDRVTQQNAAMVEESTAAGRSLSEEATELFRLAGNFRLEPGGSEGADPVARIAGVLRSRALSAAE